jgi:hypothetical protein
MRRTRLIDNKLLLSDNEKDYIKSIKTGREIYPYTIELLGSWEEFDELEINITNYLGFPYLHKDEGYIGIYTNNKAYIDYYAFLSDDSRYWRSESDLIKRYEECNLNYFKSFALSERLKEQFSYYYDGCWKVIGSLKTNYDYGYAAYGFKTEKQLDLAINVLIASESHVN